MPVPILMLPILAVAVQEAPPPVHGDKEIVVTAHAGIPFISPMGEPFRARNPTEDTLARWFYQTDRNHDGYITPDEMVADAEQFFDILDTDHDGQIDPDELMHYEWQTAPEIQVNSRTRRPRTAGTTTDDADKPDRGEHSFGDGDKARNRRPDPMDEPLQGAGRYSLLDMPEPVAAADTDLNRAVSLQEFKQAALDRFQLLDKKHEGRLSLQELEAMKPVLPAPGKRTKRGKNDPDPRVAVPIPMGPGT
jgi:Ca2+-binding EF-hand superfamily protein